MATIVLTAVGSLIGGPIGASIGSFIGSQIDQALFAPTFKSEGPRLSDLSVQASSYGNPIPRVFGPENRVSGNVIWSTGLVETKTTTKQGGKGGGAKTKTTNYSYHVDCAIGLCRGPAIVKRIWADGKLFREYDGTQKHADEVRVYAGWEDQLPDPTIQAALGAGNVPAYRALCYVVFDRLELAEFGNRLPNFTFEVEAHSTATVATVIDELTQAANVPYMDAARTDYLDIRGYTIGRVTTIRGALEPLRQAFFFDATEAEGELQFFPSDGTPVARVPSHDLGAHQFGTDRPNAYELTRSADIELPRQVTVQFLDPARDYQENSQRARRSTRPSDNDVAIELPIVLSAGEAKSIAEQIVSTAWTSRDAFSYLLPIQYLHVEPGHKIVVGHDDGKDRTLRVKRRELRLPGSLMVECANDATAILSVSSSAASAPVPVQQVTLPGLTVAHLMDLPILLDADDNSGFYVAGSGASSGWRSASLYRSLDGGVNFDSFEDIEQGAIIGVTGGVLGVGSPHYWDNKNQVTVTLLNPADALSSLNALQVLNGGNAAVIGSEIVQFQNAELIGPLQYRLSGLLRGRKGTEDQIGIHAAGERFILLTGGGIFSPDVAAAELGVSRQYRAAAAGTVLGDAPVFSFTHSGRWAKPYPAAHVKGSRNGTGDLALSWIRRTRFEAPWLDGQDAPLGEASEAYEIDVMNGAAVVRTITAATPVATYTQAEQVADFGSAQASITVRIYQISNRIGRGFAREETL